jgi:hypothetical protein
MLIWKDGHQSRLHRSWDHTLSCDSWSGAWSPTREGNPEVPSRVEGWVNYPLASPVSAILGMQAGRLPSRRRPSKPTSWTLTQANCWNLLLGAWTRAPLQRRVRARTSGWKPPLVDTRALTLVYQTSQEGRLRPQASELGQTVFAASKEVKLRRMSPGDMSWPLNGMPTCNTTGAQVEKNVPPGKTT